MGRQRVALTAGGDSNNRDAWLHHRTAITRRALEGAPSDFIADCSCGWKNHRPGMTRTEAQRKAKTHVRKRRQKDPQHLI